MECRTVDGRRPLWTSLRRDGARCNAGPRLHPGGYGHHSAGHLSDQSDRGGHDPRTIPDATGDRNAFATGNPHAETDGGPSAPACGHAHPTSHARCDNGARGHADPDSSAGNADRDPDRDRDNGPVTYCDNYPGGGTHGHPHAFGRDHDI